MKKISAEERKEYKNGKYTGGPAEERAEKKKSHKNMRGGGLAMKGVGMALKGGGLARKGVGQALKCGGMVKKGK